MWKSTVRSISGEPNKSCHWSTSLKQVTWLLREANWVRTQDCHWFLTRSQRKRQRGARSLYLDLVMLHWDWLHSYVRKDGEKQLQSSLMKTRLYFYPASNLYSCARKGGEGFHYRHWGCWSYTSLLAGMNSLLGTLGNRCDLMDLEGSKMLVQHPHVSYCSMSFSIFPYVLTHPERPSKCMLWWLNST